MHQHALRLHVQYTMDPPQISRHPTAGQQHRACSMCVPQHHGQSQCMCHSLGNSTRQHQLSDECARSISGAAG